MAEAHREEIAKLEALYAAHPEGRVFTHLAEAYRRAGELDRAREILEDGLRRHPDYSSAHVVLGRVLMDREQTDGAAAAFRRVLELDRHNLVALRSLGDLAERAGDTSAAVGYYRDLVALDPTDDRLRLTVARLEGVLAGQPEAVAEAGPEAAAEEVEEAAPVADVPGPAFDVAAEAAEGGADDDLLVLPAFGAEEDGGEQADLPAIDFPSLEGNPEEMVEEAEVVLEVEGLSLGWGDAAEPDAEVAGAGFEDDGVFPIAGWLDVSPEDGAAAETPEPVVETDAVEPGAETAAEAAEVAAAVEETAVASSEAPVEPEDAEAADTDWASVEERAAAAWRGDESESAIAGEAAGGEAVEELASEMAESVAEPGAAAGEEPAYAGGESEADDSDTVVTATMAELYAQQGFYDRAMDVYRQLLDQVPEDDRLRERLREVEARSRSGAAPDEAGAEPEAAEDWDPSVVAWTGDAGVAGGEETPYAWAEAEADADEEGGPTVGDYFATLLAWRPAARTLELTADEAVGEASAEAELETGTVAAAFEEWFGDAPSEDPEEAGREGGEGDADLEMFRSWLQSLKK